MNEKKKEKQEAEIGRHSSCPAVQCKLRFIPSIGQPFNQIGLIQTINGRTGRYTK